MPILAALITGAAMTVGSISWSELSPMPQAQSGGVSGFVAGEFVVVGGTAWRDEVKLWLNHVQIYNPRTGQWRFGHALPAPFAYGPSIYSQQGLEIFGGTTGQQGRRDSWKLDAAKAKWLRTGDTPAEFLFGRAAQIGDDVFIIGGCSDVSDLSRCSDAVWRRDQVDHWSRMTALPDGALALSAVATAQSEIFLFGGCSMKTEGQVVNHSEAYRYDPKKNRWQALQPLPAANRGLSAVAVDDRHIYLFGGYTDQGFSSDVLIYNIQTDQYLRSNPMPIPLLGIDFVLDSRKFYGAGGEDRMYSRSARLLEGQWKEPAR